MRRLKLRAVMLLVFCLWWVSKKLDAWGMRLMKRLSDGK